MTHRQFTRFEDAIILKHIGKDGSPNLYAMQTELEREGYKRSTDTLSGRVRRLRAIGRAPINYRNCKHRVRCVETGKTYESCKAATRDIGLKCSEVITRACNEPHRTAGGYHWQYI